MIGPEQISFFISGEPCAISPGSALWDLRLPGLDQSPGRITVGQYLSAAQKFLTGPDNHLLPDALAALSGSAGPVRHPDISLEKHGAFYPPLK